MENFIYLCPIIGCLFVLLFFREKFAVWEYFIIIVITALITLISISIVKYGKCNDIEYRGYYIKNIKYYESWNEWVHRRCTRTVGSGENRRTVTYDCSYCRNHPEEWVMTDNEKNEYPISKDDYNRLAEIWETKRIFVDMKRNYHTKDGDMYMYNWNNNRNSIITITKANHYKNKVLGSKSVFKFDNITLDEAKEYGLFDYPKIDKQKLPGPQYKYTPNTFQDALIGISCDSLSKKLNYINAYYGSSKFIRTYILIYKNKDRDIAFKQQSYWAGGNFNECIICVGINDNYDIKWVEAFSWEDVPYLSVKSKQYLNGKSNLIELGEFLNYYEKLLNEKDVWICKDAEDFKYLKTDLNTNEIIIILIITAFSMICVFLWGYYNEFEKDN